MCWILGIEQWCTIPALSLFQFGFQAYSESLVPIQSLLWKPDSDSRTFANVWFRFQSKWNYSEIDSNSEIGIVHHWHRALYGIHEMHGWELWEHCRYKIEWRYLHQLMVQDNKTLAGIWKIPILEKTEYQWIPLFIRICSWRVVAEWSSTTTRILLTQYVYSPIQWLQLKSVFPKETFISKSHADKSTH